ncbi:type VII toxin-antitoxin system HepT family RNase toxin [Paraglaciecola psychrophila]|jgi:uncharacterized protein YutE (UPF0331/DUF86 family)|uniref:type VII toxin-antitoxin system HepT family RNase toxin n=1 Tax=Paraglaciecola psychrophila TaxID=326544 RepID=UPI000290D028|nr:DUF86 domain-containing protein [Paraglaciecola psychrophila]GAC35940.1 hypothetical protein GPSY_0298 [Paraglaciecola psychrophila 170]
MNDVVINKIATIERCLQRINVVYAEVADNLSTDFTRQDSIVLNLQRACEASIDLANYVNKQQKLGIPQSSRDAFELLFKAVLLPEEVAVNLKKMVGLRNIAVHDYQELNIDIVRFIVENHLIDFQYFIKAIKLIPNL